MRMRREAAIGAIIFAASISASLAGPCTAEIGAVQARIDARLEAKAAGGPTGQESIGAMLSRQPTPNSIAAAEERLHELSARRVSAVKTAMARARAADAAGNIRACERALTKARRVLRSRKN